MASAFLKQASVDAISRFPAYKLIEDASFV